jgi:biopolymer transport protein ExbD
MKLHSTIRIRPDFLYLAPLLNVVLLLMVFFLLNSQEIAIGDLAARLTELKKESRYVIVNGDTTAAIGLFYRVINAINEAGCDAAIGTRAEGE